MDVTGILKITCSSCVCSDHFEPQSYHETDGYTSLRRLTKNAVPTLSLTQEFSNKCSTSQVIHQGEENFSDSLSKADTNNKNKLGHCKYDLPLHSLNECNISVVSSDGVDEQILNKSNKCENTSVTFSSTEQGTVLSSKDPDIRLTLTVEDQINNSMTNDDIRTDCSFINSSAGSTGNTVNSVYTDILGSVFCQKDSDNGLIATVDDQVTNFTNSISSDRIYNDAASNVHANIVDCPSAETATNLNIQTTIKNSPSTVNSCVIPSEEQSESNTQPLILNTNNQGEINDAGLIR